IAPRVRIDRHEVLIGGGSVEVCAADRAATGLGPEQVIGVCGKAVNVVESLNQAVLLVAPVEARASDRNVRALAEILAPPVDVRPGDGHGAGARADEVLEPDEIRPRIAAVQVGAADRAML